MAYSTSNPPVLMSQGVGGYHREWVYRSADASTDVDGAGYFSNGWDLGMRVGDSVRLVNPTTGATQIMFVNSASATGGVDLANGTAITATDSD